MIPESEAWKLLDFSRAVDRWLEREDPPDDLRGIAIGWIFTRATDPYENAELEPVMPDLWGAPVPGSAGDDGTVVMCFYYIFPKDRSVRCESFSTLAMPILRGVPPLIDPDEEPLEADWAPPDEMPDHGP